MFFHKSAPVALIALMLSMGSAAHAQTQDISERLTPLIAQTDVPALAVLTIRDGQIAAQGVAGVRDLKSQVPAQKDDVWHLGSDGKAMTATLIATLVEKGVLSWDAPLSQMLPQMADMRPEYRDVRLEDLLSHRAGLPDITSMEDTLAYFQDTRPLPVQRQEYAAKILAMEPVGPLRAAGQYSNGGYVIAGVIAESITGRAYEDLMQDYVFGPLGMTTARLGATPEGQPLGHEAGQPLTGLMADNPAVLSPAGTFHMSMEDWARFALDQLAGTKGEKALLSPASYQRLQTAQGDTRNALGWGAVPALRGIEGQFLTHVGSNGYWNALIVLRRENSSGILAVMNCGSDCQSPQVTKAVLDSFLTETVAD